MTDEKLLPCWHCGSEAKVIQADHPSYTPHGEGWYVICKCGATLGYHGIDELYMTYGDFASEEFAVMAWNTRVAVTDHDFAMAVHDGGLWGKCSECKERQWYYLDAETIQRQQERIANLTVERDAYFEMVKRVQADCDARDELVRDMWEDLVGLQGGYEELGYQTSLPEFAWRMRELGIEVDSV